MLPARFVISDVESSVPVDVTLTIYRRRHCPHCGRVRRLVYRFTH